MRSTNVRTNRFVSFIYECQRQEETQTENNSRKLYISYLMLLV